MISTSLRARVFAASVVPAAALAFAGSASAQKQIAGWGYRVFDSRWTTESFTDVSSGVVFTAGVRSNGELAAWGLNTLRQCEPPAPPAGATFVEVAAGFDHGLARLSTGAAVGWGNNVYGKATPPAGNDFVQLAAGYDFSAGLRSSGQISAWGSNNFLQLNVPFLPAGVTYTQVSAGRNYALALRSDGQAVAWGQNSDGQCNVPALPAGLTYVEVSAGIGFDAHAAARRSDGSVVAWGNNVYGQTNVPALPAGVTYIDIDAGAGWTMAKRSDGQIVLWPYASYLPAIPAGTTIVELELGGSGVLRKSNGQLISFGSNAWSECNAPALASGLSYTKVVAGAENFYALVSDGTVRAWGRTSDNALAVPVLPAGFAYVELYGGYLGGAGLISNGVLRFWGTYYSQFNLDSMSIPAGLHYESAALGTQHAAALRSDGTIVAWGDYNNLGQLNVPPLPPGLKYVALDAGTYHTIALRDDGSIVGWGDNSAGQLNVPALPAGVKYVGVVANERDSGALRSDGRFVAWGAHPLSPSLPFGVECADFALGGFFEFNPYGPQNDYCFAVALYNDGSTSTSGDNHFRQQILPALPAGRAFRDVDAQGISGVGTYDDNYGLSSPFCTTSLTTTGCEPLIAGSGSASASAATPFSVEVQRVDGQRTGILFYGVDNTGFSPPIWNPGSTSVLCVKPPTQRTALQTSGGTAGLCDGSFSLDWNAFTAANPTALGAPFTAGDRVFLQCWFRDPAAPGNTNLSNALDVAIWP